ncbi:response regulator [Pararhodobacter sp. SW119]|uniref:response regulator n=1 Tax=Pararhodobacter sp. SW119 TaxID=2780075 RepID=UPI001ADF62F8|nr:response regulator [Pararhodobacter sp. SW119]
MPSSSPGTPPLGVLPALLAVMPRPQTMLLVEDSRFAAETVRLICRAAGIRLRRVETLAAARRHLRLYRPELALIDLGLPDGSGLDLIVELAALTPRRPRIVAVSGDPEGRGAALSAGADAFCAKPLGLAAHLETILGISIVEAESILARDFLSATAARRTAIARACSGGADPMALHDDLKRAQTLLLDGRRTGYAGQFIGGIARSLNDAPLVAAADLARTRGRRRPLLTALQARVAAGPAI